MEATFNYRRPMMEVAQILKDLPLAEGEEPISMDVLSQLGNLPADKREEVFNRVRESGAFFSEQHVPVHDLREAHLTINDGGAQLVSAPSAVDFSSAEFRDASHHVGKTPQVTPPPSHQTYYHEVEQLARELLGPDVVHAFCTSHIIRDTHGADAVNTDGKNSGPIKTVHNDFTEEYGPIMKERLTTHPSQSARFYRRQLKEQHGLDFAPEDIADYRLVGLNTWRPITAEPLRREPLAVCDNRSIQKSDLLKVRTGIGENPDDPEDDFALEVFMSTPNAEHRWHYVKEFTNQELMLFKSFDSVSDWMDECFPRLASPLFRLDLLLSYARVANA